MGWSGHQGLPWIAIPFNSICKRQRGCVVEVMRAARAVPAKPVPVRTQAHRAATPAAPVAVNPRWARLALGVQTQLSVSTKDDPLEREADALADRALAQPVPADAGAMPGPGARPALGNAPDRVERALAGGGDVLEPALQQDMSLRFGFDFTGVRVHKGAAAIEAARDLEAEAFTSGDRIAFAAGRYAPDSPRGCRLLAHELAHVVQQAPRDRVQRQPDKTEEDKPTPPDSAYGPLRDASTVRNSAGRLRYVDAVAGNADQAVAAIRDARLRNDLVRAEQVAREAHAFRTDQRDITRQRMSPGSVVLSETVERDRSWKAMVDKYKGRDPFDTYEKIAAGSGRTNPTMNRFATLGGFYGAASFGWDTASGVEAVWKAPDGERARVASEVTGGMLGSLGGVELGMAGGALGAGLLLSNPGGWAILAGMGLAYLGSRYGGRAGAWIFGTPFRVMDAIELLATGVPQAAAATLQLTQAVGAPFGQLTDAFASASTGVRASLDTGNWDMRYLPATARADAMAVGQIIWQRLENLGADGLMGVMRTPLSGFSVPADLATRLALQLSDPIRTVTGQELLALPPMDFVTLLRQRDLAFIESPAILQGYSRDEGELQFGLLPLIRLRAQLSPENWIFDEPVVASRAAPLRALSRQLWARLEPLNQRGFELATTQSVGSLGVDAAALAAAARAVSGILTASSTFGLDWQVDAEFLAAMTPQDLVSYLVDATRLGFRMSPDEWADSALQQVRAGFAPW